MLSLIVFISFSFLFLRKLRTKLVKKRKISVIPVTQHSSNLHFPISFFCSLSLSQFHISLFFLTCILSISFSPVSLPSHTINLFTLKNMYSAAATCQRSIIYTVTLAILHILQVTLVTLSFLPLPSNSAQTSPFSSSVVSYVFVFSSEIYLRKVASFSILFYIVNFILSFLFPIFLPLAFFFGLFWPSHFLLVSMNFHLFFLFLQSFQLFRDLLRLCSPNCYFISPV